MRETMKEKQVGTRQSLGVYIAKNKSYLSLDETRNTIPTMM